MPTENDKRGRNLPRSHRDTRPNDSERRTDRKNLGMHHLNCKRESRTESLFTLVEYHSHASSPPRRRLNRTVNHEVVCTNLFVHAEGILGLVDDAATALLVVVLLAAGGVGELLASGLLAIWHTLTGTQLATRV